MEYKSVMWNTNTIQPMDIGLEYVIQNIIVNPTSIIM